MPPHWDWRCGRVYDLILPMVETMGYGQCINEEVLNNVRAEYGKLIVPTLSAQLQSKYGRNFEEKNLRRMMQFSEQFADLEIVVPLARQLETKYGRSFSDRNLRRMMQFASKWRICRTA
jgi:hypothetical protein